MRLSMAAHLNRRSWTLLISMRRSWRGRGHHDGIWNRMLHYFITHTNNEVEKGKKPSRVRLRPDRRCERVLTLWALMVIGVGMSRNGGGRHTRSSLLTSVWWWWVTTGRRHICSRLGRWKEDIARLRCGVPRI